MQILAANWKMHKTASEAAAFVRELCAVPVPSGRQVLLAPPFPLLSIVAPLISGTPIGLCAQNMHYAPSGAFTGEVSPLHLIDAGVTHVIIGHSERRNVFGEDNILLAKKLKSALDHGLTPLFCVGETKAERDENITFSVIEKQIDEGMSLIADEKSAWRIIVAYEPVWAIGTGVTATPDQAEEVHRFIKSHMRKKYFKNSGHDVTILYGGSVTPDNAGSLMAMPSINGALVGGASLKAETFLPIINFKEK